MGLYIIEYKVGEKFLLTEFEKYNTHLTHLHKITGSFLIRKGRHNITICSRMHGSQFSGFMIFHCVSNVTFGMNLNMPTPDKELFCIPSCMLGFVSICTKI